MGAAGGGPVAVMGRGVAFREAVTDIWRMKGPANRPTEEWAVNIRALDDAARSVLVRILDIEMSIQRRRLR